jgi:hypothetical protein
MSINNPDFDEDDKYTKKTIEPMDEIDVKYNNNRTEEQQGKNKKIIII